MPGKGTRSSEPVRDQAFRASQAKFACEAAVFGKIGRISLTGRRLSRKTICDNLVLRCASSCQEKYLIYDEKIALFWGHLFPDSQYEQGRR